MFDYRHMLFLVFRQLELEISHNELQERINQKIEDQQLALKQLEERIGKKQLRKIQESGTSKDSLGYLSQFGAAILVAEDLGVDLFLYCPSCGLKTSILSELCEKCGLKLPGERLKDFPFTFEQGIQDFRSLEDAIRLIRSWGGGDDFVKSFKERALQNERVFGSLRDGWVTAYKQCCEKRGLWRK
ncbi:MAG: hypothetical protein WBA22_05715 [Candidatus Methanofastidiosia archaeon]